MHTWILLITFFAQSSQSTDSIYSVRFNSKIACEREAAKIDKEGECLNPECTVTMRYRIVECIEDGPEILQKGSELK